MEEHQEEEEEKPPTLDYYNSSYNEFLHHFETLKTNEYKMENEPSTFVDLPTLSPIRDQTIETLKKIREEVFDVLYKKYGDDEKLLANKDTFKPYSYVEHEDIEDFIRLSKNISQLEKGIYTDENKEMMFLLGEKFDFPPKKMLDKILDFLKEHKVPFLLILLSAALGGVIVNQEKGLHHMSQKVKELIIKELARREKDLVRRVLLKIIADSLDILKSNVPIFLLLLFTLFTINKNGFFS